MSICRAKRFSATRFDADPPGVPNRRRSVVDSAQLRVIVDQMLVSRAVHMPLFPRSVERRLYTNCMKVVFMLLEDLLTGENEGVSFMGHKLRFHLDLQPVDLLRRVLESNPVAHCRINEEALFGRVLGVCSGFWRSIGEPRLAAARNPEPGSLCFFA